jgi:hypothetical protein
MKNENAIVLPVLSGANTSPAHDIGDRILQLMTAEGVREAFTVLYKGAGEHDPVQRRDASRPRSAPVMLRLVSHSVQILLYYFPDTERGWLVIKPNRLPLPTIEQRISTYLHYGLGSGESGTLISDEGLSLTETAGVIKAIAA